MPGLLAAFVAGVCAMQWQAELPGPGLLLLVGLAGATSIAVALRTARLAPSLMFTQSGYRNRYGHPDPGVVDRYAARGLARARTAHGGLLQWRFGADGSAEHTVARATAVRYWHNRPFTGQERPLTDTLDDDGSDEAPREPLSGMP